MPTKFSMAHPLAPESTSREREYVLEICIGPVTRTTPSEENKQLPLDFLPRHPWPRPPYSSKLSQSFPRWHFEHGPGADVTQSHLRGPGCSQDSIHRQSAVPFVLCKDPSFIEERPKSTVEPASDRVGYTRAPRCLHIYSVCALAKDGSFESDYVNQRLFDVPEFSVQRLWQAP